MPRRRTVALAAGAVAVVLVAGGATTAIAWQTAARSDRAQTSMEIDGDPSCTTGSALTAWPGHDDDPETGDDWINPTFLPSVPLDCTVPLLVTNASDSDVVIESLRFPSGSHGGMGLEAAGLTGHGIHRGAAADVDSNARSAIYRNVGLHLAPHSASRLVVRITDNGWYCSGQGTAASAEIGMTVSARGIAGRGDTREAVIQVTHLDGVQPPCGKGATAP